MEAAESLGAPAPNAKRGSSERRLSWADEGNMALAETIRRAHEDSAAGQAEEAGEIDLPGEVTAHFGILGAGNCYGLGVPLSPVVSRAEVLPPLPQGVEVEVRPREGAEPSALEAFVVVDLPVEADGRFFHSVKLRQDGSEFPEITLHVEASVLGASHGKPPKCHANVVLLRSAARASRRSSEGAEWAAAKAQLQAESIDEDP